MVLMELSTSLYAREQKFNKENFMAKNFVLITGNLGNDIELKILDNNKRVCNFSIAESYPTS
jgi:Single-strand binding protein family